MLLGVVSDTHGNIELTRRAIRMLDSLAVDMVLHCGDIGSTAIVPMFERWPTHFVFGNVDYDVDALSRAIAAAGQTCHDRFGELTLEGRRIALLHSDDGERFRQTCQSGQWDLVCYGHTHKAKQEMIGATLVLNPGAVFRATPHSIAVVELAEIAVRGELHATIVPLD